MAYQAIGRGTSANDGTGDRPSYWCRQSQRQLRGNLYQVR